MRQRVFNGVCVAVAIVVSSVIVNVLLAVFSVVIPCGNIIWPFC